MDAATTTLSEWLEQLASGSPAPGGGAAGALLAAIAASLVEMAAPGPRARELRGEALRLVTDDAAAFAAVTGAHRGGRKEEILAAFAAASEVPRRTALVAAETLVLALEAAPRVKAGIAADLVVAAVSARAALDAARTNVESNQAAVRRLRASA